MWEIIMQLHKGGGSSTTVQSYEPTPEERRLWEIQGDYAEKMNPYVYKLADLSEGLLTDSFGANQYDFTSLNNAAQRQIANANNMLSGITSSNNAGMTTANNALGNLTSQYNNAANIANSQLAGLAQGQIPSAYQDAMANSISSALNRTMGQNLNNLANRGVLNSSVTQGAMNDISRNAADSVAQQYQNNIGQLANLYNQQLSNSNNAYDQAGGIIQNQLNNLLTANTDNAGIYQQLLGNANAPITTAAAAQEAAQQPAMNLLNASLGTNAGSAGSALQALAGTGTTTSQQTMKQSGGLLGGLMGMGTAALGNSSLWCFTGDTKVTMADGTEKNIADIVVGDEVMAEYNDDSVIDTVVEVAEPVEQETYIVECENGSVNTTLSQPLMNENGDFIEVELLKLGTKLRNMGKVKAITKDKVNKVYDFKTENTNCYYANGFVAYGAFEEDLRGE